MRSSAWYIVLFLSNPASRQILGTEVEPLLLKTKSWTGHDSNLGAQPELSGNFGIDTMPAKPQYGGDKPQQSKINFVPNAFGSLGPDHQPPLLYKDANKNGFAAVVPKAAWQFFAQAGDHDLQQDIKFRKLAQVVCLITHIQEPWKAWLSNHEDLVIGCLILAQDALKDVTWNPKHLWAASIITILRKHVFPESTGSNALQHYLGKISESEELLFQTADSESTIVLFHFSVTNTAS